MNPYLTFLKQAVVNNALLRGEFTLKSGKKSDYYIDLRKVTLSSNLIWIVYALIYEIGYEHLDINAIGGPSIGADPIVGGMMTSYHDVEKLHGFLIRKEEKQHGIKDLIIGSLQPGDKCLIVEDTTTTGESLLRACNIVKDYGCEIVKAISIVDRLDGAKQLLKENNIKFSCLLDIEDILS